jgi:hypothetical protein
MMNTTEGKWFGQLQAGESCLKIARQMDQQIHETIHFLLAIRDEC